MRRSIELGSEVARDPEKQYMSGYFAGAGLARNIFNVDEETLDWQKGLIDSAGAIAGETVSDLSLDALRGDIRWRDVPMEIVRTPQQLATGMGTMIQKSADGSIGMNMVEGASDGWEDRRARARWNPRFALLFG